MPSGRLGKGSWCVSCGACVGFATLARVGYRFFRCLKPFRDCREGRSHWLHPLESQRLDFNAVP